VSAVEKSVARPPMGQVIRIATSQVKPMPGQPRLHFDPVQLARLRDSIAEIGQQQPATVVIWPDGTYRLRDGERRWRCCTQLRIPLVALVVEARSVEEEFELAAAANMNRESHSPFERAMAMKRLRDGPLKRSTAEIARTFGVTATTVYNHLLVVDSLPKAILKLMDANQCGGRARTLQLSAAMRLTALSAYPREQLRIAQRIVEESLPLPQALHLIDRAGDRYQVDTGRGRERKPSDHGRSVLRALKQLNASLGQLFREDDVVDELFVNMPAKRLKEVQAEVRLAQESLDRFAEVAGVEDAR
jgi:ParB family chromosome partitioning protein